MTLAWSAPAGLDLGGPAPDGQWGVIWFVAPAEALVRIDGTADVVRLLIASPSSP